jgi:hypothetical protein
MQQAPTTASGFPSQDDRAVDNPHNPQQSIAELASRRRFTLRHRTPRTAHTAHPTHRAPHTARLNARAESIRRLSVDAELERVRERQLRVGGRGRDAKVIGTAL